MSKGQAEDSEGTNPQAYFVHTLGFVLHWLYDLGNAGAKDSPPEGTNC
jgi:hypothetical protein